MILFLFNKYEEEKTKNEGQLYYNQKFNLLFILASHFLIRRKIAR